jgi:predicted alpha/beta-hydrolase family hydrolase
VNVTPFEPAGVRGALHQPEREEGRGLVLTHGAGGNCNAPLLVRMADAFAMAGLCVLRCDLPFRQRRPKGPPSPSTAAADREGLRAAVMALRGLVPGAVFLGGHSYGGRQATMLAAEDPEIAAALLLFSYPLHPPGKPERRRTEHFARIPLPCVFVHGTRDAFGSPDELRRAIAALPASTNLIMIEGAGHDLRKGNFDPAPIVAALLGAEG